MKKTFIMSLLAAALMLAPGATRAQNKAAAFHRSYTKEPVAAANDDARRHPAGKTSPELISFTRQQTAVPRQLVGEKPKAPANAPKAPLRALGDGTTIFGSLAYMNTWTSYQYGIYSFSSGTDLTPAKVSELESEPNGGGTIMGDKFVYNYFIYTTEMGFTFSSICQRDMKTGKETKVTQIYPNQSQVTYALAYDQTTDVMYGLSYMTKYIDDDQLVQKWVPCLSTVDIITGVVTPVAELPKMSFLAITPGGEMFAAGTGYNSKLYRINKNTGAYTEIGATGVAPANYTQSAAFDALTGKLYWACTHMDGSSALYEVSTTTGAASKIADFSHDEEYTGLYVPEAEVAEGAPAKVGEFGVEFTNGSLSGKVKGVAPSLSKGGQSLSGQNLTVTLRVDKQAAETKTVAAGQAFEFSETLTEGIHNFDIVAANAAGEGQRLAIAKYIGIDAPAVPTGITLTAAADGKAHLVWTAPTIGMNDGYIDPAQLTYKIVRQPDGKVVADAATGTVFEEEVTAKPDNYYYEITPYCGGRQGLTAASNKGVFGSGSSLPYTWNFDSKEEFNLWTVVDANGDFNDLKYGKWQYGEDLKVSEHDGKLAVYKWHTDNTADDWLISPPFSVEKGKKYEVTYYVATKGQEEKLQVAAGDLNEVSHLTAISEVLALKNKDFVEKKAQFTATKDGNFYIAFHALSVKNRYYLMVDDVSVDEVPNNDAPAAVRNMTVKADEQGDLKATVAFAAPDKTKDGKTLQSLTKVDIFHGNETTPVYTFTSVTPGQQLSWTETVPALGTYTYRVVPANAAGAGDKTVASVYVGPDKAKAVGNLTLTETAGRPTITWEAPTEGQNGGFVSPDQTTYRIVRVCDHNSLNRVLSARFQNTTYTDNNTDLDPTKSQYYLSYEVIPVTAAGEGETAESNSIIYGNPYADGFAESFPSKTTMTGPWTVDPTGNGNYWTLKYNGEYPQCNPVDEDGGLIVYGGSDAKTGSESRLISPKINVKNFIVPLLKFCIYHYTNESDFMDEEYVSNSLRVEARLSNGDVVDITPKAIDVSNGYTGWVRWTFSLEDLKQAEWFQLVFVGKANTAYGYDIALDNIQIENANDYDLQAYSFAGPTKVNAGRTAKYSLNVANKGYYEALNYTVDFLRDGQVVKTVSGEPLQRNAFKEYTFEAATTEADQGKTFSYSARINFMEDRVQADNTSNTVQTTVTAPLYPEVYTLNAQKVDDHKAFVFWEKPDAIHITDDFETYPAWAINGVGNYTLTDVDGLETYAFSDMKFTNANDPKAYIVFNPVALGVNILSEWQTHSGSQVMAAFAANGAANDDWLISPLVHGGEKVSFYAKTAGDMWASYGFETFEVLYSSTTTDVKEFHTLSGSVETTTAWTRYEYELPVNAKYFAIRCTSDNRFVFYVDDLSYVEKVDGNNFNVTGYNVYRNGQLIKQLPATSMNMFDENLADGIYKYSVAAVYANGEAGKSKEVEVNIGNVDGIDAVATDGDAADKAAEVHTIDGKLVGKAVDRKQLKRGVYVVDGKKTAVK